MERADVVYADRFADLSDATFIFIGAFDWGQLAVPGDNVSGQHAHDRTEAWMDHGIDPPIEVEERVVRSGRGPRGNTVLAFAGDVVWTRQEALALNVAADMPGNTPA